MRRVLRVLLSRWVVSGFVVLQASLVVWFLGVLLTPFEPAWTRLLLIGVLVLLWLGVNLWLDWRQRRRDAALASGVVAPDPSAAAVAEEEEALRDKLAAALALLRKARGTRGYLYEQPWYVLIGPPGAGKTTALLNAGLRFPLAAELGAGSVPGVSGTRLCDWWFTDQAVLIDTAGRYTTQDSDPEVDRAGWQAFLDLLRRTRPRQPLNGVLAVISLADLALSVPEERAAHARAVRRRVKELEEHLGLRLPVYALFTKADLIAGFTEFFDDLDAEQRAQVWGTTFPLSKEDAGNAGLFPERFRALVARLDERLLERLQAERSPDRRALLAGFPAQAASMEGLLSDFLRDAFGGSRLDPAPNLRGAYLTSGTQEGTPFDRLTATLARGFGVDQRRAPSLGSRGGRSYFLRRLVENVIFGEAMLASDRPDQARRRRLLQGAGYAAALLLLLGGAALLLHGRQAAEREADAQEAALAQYEARARSVTLDPVAEADFARVLPVLDAARGLVRGQDRPWWDVRGLGQDAKLEAGARTAYRNALDRVLLPRLVWRLETQMRANLGRPEYLYEATRVYLMLGGAGPLDRDLVRAWMAQDWDAQYPGPAAAPVRAGLLGHLDALLSAPLPPVDLDMALVGQARATFSRVPSAVRAYAPIRDSAAARRLPPWRPADALGAAGADLFVRGSGKPLTEGIPGFLTVDGFHGVLLPALASAASRVASESWVLGERAAVQDAAGVQALERGVIELYTADCIREWNALLADLNVAPMGNPAQAAKALYILGSPDSPMRDLLAGVARQVTLSVPPPAPPGTAKPAAAASDRVKAATGSADGPAPKPPGANVDEAFKALRDAVGNGPGSPLDRILRPLNALQQQLAAMAASPAGTAPAPGTEDPVALLRAEAARQPQPVSRWLLAIAASGGVLRGGVSRQAVVAAYNGAGGPAALCRQAVPGRYPFASGATDEIPLEDFNRLFAPGGMLDRFFTEQLRPFVDTSVKPWRPQEAAGIPPPVQPRDVLLFQRAQDIRDVFFASGREAAVKFDVMPTGADPGTRQVTLDLGLDQPIRYAAGPPSTTAVMWPGPSRMLRVRLGWEPPPRTGPAVFNETGPWALFRLFDKGEVRRVGGPELYAITWRLEEREATFELRANSVQNPLLPGLLRGFQCPAIQ